MPSFDQFLDFVAKSGLVDEFQLAVVVKAASTELPRDLADGARAQRFADMLVERGLLTKWQCTKLLEGRYKGFHLGRYELVDFLGTIRVGSRYLVKTKEGLAEIIVAPVGGKTFFIAIKPGSFLEDDVLST